MSGMYLDLFQCERLSHHDQTDVCCVYCERSFCFEMCLKYCDLCIQPVCIICFENDLCCSQQGKSELLLEKFYENGKILPIQAFQIVARHLLDDPSPTRNHIRLRCASESVKWFFEHNLIPTYECFGEGYSLFAQCFEREIVRPYIDGSEEQRQKLVAYVKHLCDEESPTLSLILLHSKDRERILEFFDELNEEFLRDLLERSLEDEKNGRELFLLMKKRDLLAYRFLDFGSPCKIQHVDGMLFHLDFLQFEKKF